jgi:hypothetical protein
MPFAMPPAHSRFDWKFWFLGVTAMMAGAEFIPITIVLSDHVPHFAILEKPAAETAVAGILIAVLGAAFAVFQWLWLRSRLKLSAWWIPATSLSWFLFGACCYLANSSAIERLAGNFRPAWYVMTATTVFGLLAVVITIPQWLVIRNRLARPAAWWFLARPIGWLVGAGLLALAAVLNAFDPGIFSSPKVFGVMVPPLVAFSFAAQLVAFGFAAVTALALIWMCGSRG